MNAKEKTENATREFSELKEKAKKLYLDTIHLDIEEENNETKKSYQKVIAKLLAIVLIDEYDNIIIDQHQGVHIYRTPDSFLPNKIEPTGKKTACIKMWSGMDFYTENKDILNDPDPYL